jgi:hypothetical protein
MIQQPIQRGENFFIHPTTGSYLGMDENGFTRIGTADGDAIVITPEGDVYINANRLHIISDEIIWKDLRFNKSATNPTQPALLPKGIDRISQELSQYNR